MNRRKFIAGATAVAVVGPAIAGDGIELTSIAHPEPKLDYWLASATHDDAVDTFNYMMTARHGKAIPIDEEWIIGGKPVMLKVTYLDD